MNMVNMSLDHRYSAPSLPEPTGPISRGVVRVLKGHCAPSAIALGALDGDLMADDDFQLALYILYELHYRGFENVDPDWEWKVDLLAVRQEMERAFLSALYREVGHPEGAIPTDIDVQLWNILETSDVSGMPRFLETRGTMEQFREYAIHRSAYQLKEADPHSWAIPRLDGAPKAALLEIQSDEYGNGSLRQMHSELFAQTMRELGLDDRYGRYIDAIPGATLLTVNVMSMFGLQRRWRGAIIGNLAAFEMGSSLPNRRYSNALARLGASKAARAFYDVHVLADAAHENVAAVDLAGGLAAQQPELAGDILFGARTLVGCEARLFKHLLGSWERGESSLRDGYVTSSRDQ